MLVACGLIAALAFPTTAPAQPLVTGASSNYYQSSDPGTRAFWLDRTVSSGAGLVRLGVSWRNVVGSQRPPDPANPGSGSYDFSSIDPTVRDAEARGLAVLLTLGASAPDWAEGPGRAANARPGTWRPNLSDLANFVQAVAARYSGRFDPGSGPLPAVQALQVWDEPNQDYWLSPAYQGSTPVSPAYYRQMLNASYPAVKAVNPQMLVVTGGTSPYGDPPGGPYPDPNNRRIWPVTFWQQVLCVHPVKVKSKKGKKGKKKEAQDEASEDAGLYRPIVRRPRPPGDRQHRLGAAQVRPQSQRRFHAGSGPGRERAPRLRARRARCGAATRYG